MQEAGDTDGGCHHKRGLCRVLLAHQQHRHDRDQRDVEQQRRERGQRKASLRVEQRHHHGDRAGESKVGQHQPCVVDGELQRVAADEAGRDRRDHQRHQNADHQRGRDHGGADGAEHAAGEGGCRIDAVRVARLQPCRHQRGVQAALGQQPSHHVDKLKRRQEGIRHRPRAKQRRDHGIAHETEQS